MVTSIFQVVLEIIRHIRDTIITSADEIFERSRFDMVEFGEQLRRARESKGMTQQSLAEQLYVTRQAVSRWECGDRYPDLLTTKKISVILDVSLDDLLSGNEMKNIVERNPVIEKGFANSIMMILYGFIVLSFLITLVDIIIRFPIQTTAIDYSDIQILAVNVVGLGIVIFAFGYGLVHAIRGMLSPSRMGIVISLYFLSIILIRSDLLVSQITRRLLLWNIVFMIPALLGAIAAILFFVKKSQKKVYPIVVVAATGFEMIRVIISVYQLLTYADQFYSLNTTFDMFLKICVDILIVYQVYTLYIKRKRGSDENND